jgi:cytochrome c peroxidase
MWHNSLHELFCLSVMKKHLISALAILSLNACNTGTTTEDPALSTSTWQWQLPPSFPVPFVPADNPMTADKVELGRHLFYDVRLSGNGKQSCGSCHLQEKAFTDGLAVAVGSTGQLHPRNSQHLSNVVYNATITWANFSLTSLERQMEVPLFGDDPIELGINDHNKVEILQRFETDKQYQQLFNKAFPEQNQPVNYTNIIKAIASFQRSLISGNSRYDQSLTAKAKLTDSEIRGKDLFFGEKAECFHCHGSFNFNDQVRHAGTRILETPFHNTGLFNIGGTGDFPFPNRGVFELSGKAQDMGKFRAPSLRNVAVTAPYMHDGSIATLEQVLDFYAAGGRNITEGVHAGDGRNNPFKSELVTLIELNEQEKADIVAFLKTLTDDEFLHNPKFANPFLPQNP